jgi:membrane protease YdiL (CAAX protease family)
MISINYQNARELVKFSIVESAKICVVYCVLNQISLFSLLGTPLAPRRFLQIIVSDPLKEELCYRGALYTISRMYQYSLHKWIHGREASEEEQQLQKKACIHLTAAFFAASHIFVPYSSTYFRVKNLAYCYLNGVAYGYLASKFQTLSIPYLFHGTNNLLGCCLSMSKNPQVKNIYKTGIFANLFFAYYLGC